MADSDTVRRQLLYETYQTLGNFNVQFILKKIYEKLMSKFPHVRLHALKYIENTAGWAQVCYEDKNKLVGAVCAVPAEEMAELITAELDPVFEAGKNELYVYPVATFDLDVETAMVLITQILRSARSGVFKSVVTHTPQPGGGWKARRLDIAPVYSEDVLRDMFYPQDK